MREVFIYLRDERKRPVVTLCLIKTDSGEIARGMAVCSPKDMPSKTVGRMHALCRAEEALYCKEVIPIVEKNPIKVVFNALCASRQTKRFLPFMSVAYWSVYAPVLSGFEAKVLGL